MPNRNLFKSNEEYNEWFRNYRRKNREKMRIYNRIYNREWRKENGYHSEIKWKRNNPEKVKAEAKLHRAVKRGVIKRQPCYVCGSENSMAHHPDYSKPLSVKWVCAICHYRERG